MARTTQGARSKAAGKANARGALPDVYGEILAEVISSSPTRKSEDGATVKRRRVGGRLVAQSVDGNASPRHEQSTSAVNENDIDDLFEEPNPTPQHIEQTETEDSADSDEYFEDVDLDSNVQQDASLSHEAEGVGVLDLVLGEDNQKTARSAQVRRKPITSTEKKLRLEIHKMHLCSLLAHAYLRNHWCNDESVHSVCKKLLTKKTISYLNPNESISQFQRSRSFMDGLQQASDAFAADFRITARGMSKPVWADSPETLALLQPPEDIDLPMQRADFLAAAGILKASRDVGAQLFCAMLRAAGVDARLVCSLLPLPFQPAQKTVLAQVMHNASKSPHHRSQQAKRGSDDEATDEGDGSITAEGKVGSSRAEIRSRLGQVKRSASPKVPSSRVSIQHEENRKPICESRYPVYWVEAFNEAVQKWVPVDPLVTKTIAKPSKFEPPAGDSKNNMSYVIAFEDDGSAHDVTRRYAKAYNAKIRRDRVEVIKDGNKWLLRVMRLYRRSHEMDRDQVEGAELSAKEAAEPMPRNVQDFKDHPYYALERHLKRHEVIHPKREVGKVGVGRPGTTNGLEPIYRRRDVHQLKSADKWYRMGREIKHGEQPLKRIAARRTHESPLDLADMDAADDDNAGTALYAPHQTSLYVAPPVSNSQIPKNVYGNLDIYVPSMVPPGGTHISNPETSRAAKILGIDYADAVTGFSFTGRHGTAITSGAVVATEYQEAVEEVIQAFEDERAQAEEERRSLAALKMWKRFLVGLRIRERIEGYDIEGERDIARKFEMEEAEEEDEDEAGGFLPDREADEPAQPTAMAMPTPKLSGLSNDDEGGGFLAGEALQEEEEALHTSDRFINNVDDDDYCGGEVFAGDVWNGGVYSGGFYLPDHDDKDGEDFGSYPNHDDEDGEDGGFYMRYHDEDGDDEGVLLKNDDEDAEEAIQEINRDGHEDTSSTGEQRADLMSAERKDHERLDQGGDFLIDDDDIRDEAPSTDDSTESSKPESGMLGNHSSIDPRDTSQIKEHPEHTSPSLSVGELEEARILQQLHESQESELLSVPKEMVGTPAPRKASDSPPMREIRAGGEQDTTAQPGETYPNKPVASRESEIDSSEDEKGSLLSHDPDDEDADPEWLA